MGLIRATIKANGQIINETLEGEHLCEQVKSLTNALGQELSDEDGDPADRVEEVNGS